MYVISYPVCPAGNERCWWTEDTLWARFVGQDHVIGAISDAALPSRAGLQTCPVASFLFLGSTGVGKGCAGCCCFFFLLRLFTGSLRLRQNCARRLQGSCSTTSTGQCESLIAFVILIAILTQIIGLTSICQKCACLDSNFLYGSKKVDSIMIDILSYARICAF